MNIAVYKGQFQYYVVNYFAEEISQGLKELSHNVHLLDLVLSFNGINAIAKSVFEELNASLGIIFVDHPFFHVSRIKRNMGDTTFFVCMI